MNHTQKQTQNKMKKQSKQIKVKQNKTKWKSKANRSKWSKTKQKQTQNKMKKQSKQIKVKQNKTKTKRQPKQTKTFSAALQFGLILYWFLQINDILRKTYQGLFHKTCLPNKPKLFQLFRLILNQINWQ